MRATLPGTVGGRIAELVVLALNCHSVWWIAHILKKVFKRKPSSAHGYPACTIMFVIFVIWVATPLYHVRPYSVNLRGSEYTAVAMRATFGGEKCGLHTSTGFGVSCLECAGENVQFRTANTLASKPGRVSGSSYYCGSQPNHSEITECDANQLLPILDMGEIHWNHSNHST